LDDGFLDCLDHVRRFVAPAFEAPLHDLLFTRALRDAGGIGFTPARQVIERGDDALEFGVEIFVAIRLQIRERDLRMWR
jgi:hypothetical protein